MKITEVKGLNFTVVKGTDDAAYSSICSDTRKVQPGCLFVCVRGLKFDPHDVCADIVKKGAAGIVIEHDCDIPEGVNVYKTPDSRTALALISACSCGYPTEKMTMIGITGTKGKTTTAAMTKHLLESAGHKVGLIGTLGIQIGEKLTPTLNTTPDSTELQAAFAEMVREGCDCAVMEVSSQAVMMNRVAGIEYDYGIFTNISNDHIGEGEHKDFAEYLMYKTKLFDHVKHAFINADDEHASYVMQHSSCPDKKTFGTGADADFLYGNVRCVSADDFIGLEFDILPGKDADDKYDGLVMNVGIPGEFNAPNAMAAFCVCHALGVSKEVLADSLKTIRVNGRMDLVYVSKEMKVIVDFAHNAVSTESLLTTLRSYHPKRLVVVFGCGGNRSPERRYDMGRIAGQMADFSIITEDNSRMESIESILADIHSTFDLTGGKSVDVPERAEAVLYAIEHHEPGDYIAIIGKGHEDYIDKNGKRTHYTDREAVDAALEICRKKGVRI